MAALSCCGNQPTPIIIGLLVTYSIGLINCYTLYGSALPSSLPSSASSAVSSNGNANLVTVSQSSSQSLPQPSNLNRHSSLPGGLTLIRASGREKSDLGVANSGSGRIVLSGLPNGFGNGNKQRLVFAQPSTSPIDFDYVPYIQSDFNPASLSSALAAVSSGSDRNGDLYEEADYNDPVYDLKYDPIQDANWLNEAISSSYRQPQQQQQQQQPQISVLPSVPFLASSLPDNSGSLPSPNSDEYLSNLMLTFIVKELERSAQQQQQPPLSSQSSEPVQHSVKLQKQANVEGLKSYEGFGLEKKSFNRDKGTIKSGENQMESAKRIEQRGQKEFAMLRPAIESNGKDDIDSQSSLSSQLQSVSATLSTTTTTTTERSDEEVNQLRSLLQ
uniref:Uncharacterized protein n=1 Tax=Tetranychus urticae TaxID=32264 RepID=T1KXC5_TETUR